MAEVTIRFRHNPKTGKRELLIGFESDADALAHEHERDHRALVEKLIGRPVGDDEDVTFERITKGEAGMEPERADETGERAVQAEKAGD